MATIFDQALTLTNDPEALRYVMSSPQGLQRYNVPGYGDSSFVRPKSPEELAALVSQVRANVNPYAGKAIGDTPGQAYQALLSRRAQDLDVAKFNAQLAAQNARAAEDNARRREAAQLEWQTRQGMSDADRTARMVSALSTLAARNPGASRTSGGAISAGGGPTVADILYGQSAALQGQQANTEDALAALSRQVEEQVRYLGTDEGGNRVFNMRGGLPEATLPADDAALWDTPDWSGPQTPDGDPSRTLRQAYQQAQEQQRKIKQAQDLLDLRIKAESAAGRMKSAVASKAPRQPTMLETLLAATGAVGSANPDGTITYSPAEVATARAKAGWRGAYGANSAYGSNPDERGRKIADDITKKLRQSSGLSYLATDDGPATRVPGTRVPGTRYVFQPAGQATAPPPAPAVAAGGSAYAGLGGLMPALPSVPTTSGAGSLPVFGSAYAGLGGLMPALRAVGGSPSLLPSYPTPAPINATQPVDVFAGIRDLLSRIPVEQLVALRQQGAFPEYPTPAPINATQPVDVFAGIRDLLSRLPVEKLLPYLQNPQVNDGRVDVFSAFRNR